MNARLVKMSFRFLFFIVLLCLAFVSIAQDVTLRSQADVDEFDSATTVVNGNLIIGELSTSTSDITQINNLSNLTNIMGDLIISRNVNLININALSNLSAISGYLSIITNTNLANVDGLINLTSMGTGEDLIVFGNNRLIDLDGLSNLTSRVNTLRISENAILANVDGLGNLTSIEKDIEIEGNERLLNIDGLENITSIERSIIINNNANLISINGFNNLATIDGSVSIFDNGSLLNINGFNILSSVAVNLYVYDNDNLVDVDGFNVINNIGGSLAFSDNVNLISVNGMSSLTTLGFSLRFSGNNNLVAVDFNSLLSIGKSFEFRENASFINIDDFDSLTSVAETILLSDNGSLANINGLSNITSIGGNLSVLSNGSLVSLEGLDDLNSIGGSVSIQNNVNLSSVDGLNNLISVGEDIIVQENENLENLNGLINLNSIVGSLSIIDNDDLIDVSGLNNLTFIGAVLRISDNEVVSSTYFNSLISIGGFLEISQNPSLISISKFENLTSIAEYVNIVNNDSLEDLDGLNNITSLAGGLFIRENNSLANLDHLIAMNSLGGNLTIQNNASITHLEGVSNISSIGGNLGVANNQTLKDCCGIQEIIENQITAIGGGVFISGNPSQCNSIEEVLEAACEMRITLLTAPPCVGDSNGSIHIYVEGYESIPFYYEWMREEDGAVGNGVSQSDDFLIDMLSAGTYNITVTTPTPETAIRIDVVLSQMEGSIFEILEVNTINSGNGQNNGSITLVTAGGTEPYTYLWSGESDGNQSGVTTENFTITSLKYGEYSVTVQDANGSIAMLELTLLDDDVEVIPCNKPLDIVILNDVSNSVDLDEYEESKQFFLDFLNEVNIGLEPDNSRAAIMEWSSSDEQLLRLPFTGDLAILQSYIDVDRAFSSGTAPHEAMLYAQNYMDANARPDAEKVLILSTDGTGGQISSSLVALADQFKANGYHIITIAIEAAYNDLATREILKKVASINVLAPGAPAYNQLDANLAQQIVNNYLCPIDPGSSATAFFSRDGEIEIMNVVPLGNCPYPEFVEVTIDISAYRELSIPAGTPITFYHNDPSQSGATSILTWIIPCAIAVGTTETFIITLPMDGPSNIFAVLNDNGMQGPPISFPITETDELAYSNNIDNKRICLDGQATLQAFKYSSLPSPSCDTIVNYTINVCNVSEIDAFGVSVTDVAPTGFVLTGSIFNDNGCAVDLGGTYDLPADCCFSLFLTYDAALAANGYYGNQGVNLDGPSNQTYYDFDGNTTTDEDVNIDGTIDCPSTIIEFLKSVNIDETCDDSYVEFTFTINNEMNIPLQGLTFSDILPDPCTWVFMPYGVDGLSIGNVDLIGNEVVFTIDEVAANTVATFHMDASLNFWDADGILNNTATLSNVPDVVNGGLTTLISNTTSTQVTAAPKITIPDTIIISIDDDAVNLSAILSSQADVFWTSNGDGEFVDSTSEATMYIVGTQDSIDGEVILFISAISDCNETGASVVVKFADCNISVEIIGIGECDNMGTPFDGSDDIYEVVFIVNGEDVGPNSMFIISFESYTDTLSYFVEHTVSLPVIGLANTLSFVDLELGFCYTEIEVNQEFCTEECIITSIEDLLIYDCQDNDTPLDTTDDYYIVEFSVPAYNPSIDSTFNTIYNGQLEGIFSYGQLASLTLPADSVLDSILIVDSNIDTCVLWLVVNQGNCYSEDCLEELSTISIEELILADCDIFTANLTALTNVLDTAELTYAWINSEGDLIGEEIEIEIEAAGKYFVSVNYCDETIVDSILVISDPEIDLQWPKVFFPNGMEEENRTFGPYNECEALVTEYSLRIFNRWGNEVFTSDDLSLEWDGQHGGSDSASAVYVYVVEYTLNGRKYPVVKGDVTLLRN